MVGLLVDAAVEDRHISIRSGFRARTLLLSVWLLTGFLITSGYKSVLLSTLISIEYERPIDTIKDLLETEIPILMDDVALSSIFTDPRDSIREIGKKITPYEMSGGKMSEGIRDR